MKPFGIGTGFDDLKSNASVNTVQSENVWTPYYEVNFIELDFKEKMMQKQAEKALDLGGAEVKELEKQLKEHDERVKAGIQEAKDAAAGIKTKKFKNSRFVKKINQPAESSHVSKTEAGFVHQFVYCIFCFELDREQCQLNCKREGFVRHERCVAEYTRCAFSIDI